VSLFGAAGSKIYLTRKWERDPDFDAEDSEEIKREKAENRDPDTVFKKAYGHGTFNGVKCHVMVASKGQKAAMAVRFSGKFSLADLPSLKGAADVQFIPTLGKGAIIIMGSAPMAEIEGAVPLGPNKKGWNSYMKELNAALAKSYVPGLVVLPTKAVIDYAGASNPLQHLKPLHLATRFKLRDVVSPLGKGLSKAKKKGSKTTKSKAKESKAAKREAEEFLQVPPSMQGSGSTPEVKSGDSSYPASISGPGEEHEVPPVLLQVDAQGRPRRRRPKPAKTKNRKKKAKAKKKPTPAPTADEKEGEECHGTGTVGLAQGKCCDRRTRRVIKGAQTISTRWCKKSSKKGDKDEASKTHAPTPKQTCDRLSKKKCKNKKTGKGCQWKNRKCVPTQPKQTCEKLLTKKECKKKKKECRWKNKEKGCVPYTSTKCADLRKKKDCKAQSSRCQWEKGKCKAGGSGSSSASGSASGSSSGSESGKGKSEGSGSSGSGSGTSNSGKTKAVPLQTYFKRVEEENPANEVQMYGYINTETKEFQMFFDVTGKVGVLKNSAAMVWATVASVEFSNKGQYVYDPPTAWQNASWINQTNTTQNATHPCEKIKTKEDCSERKKDCQWTADKNKKNS
jgi:hypothetical protein